VLEAAEGRTNRAIASDLSIDPETVALWRRRFSMNRLDGIRWDAPRAGHRPDLPQDLIERIWRIPPHGTRPDGSVWTTRQLAHSLGVSHMRVQRAWQAHRLGATSVGASGSSRTTLHGVHQIDVAGVYLAPHGRAIVFQVETFFEPTVARAVMVEPPTPPVSRVASHSGWDGLLVALDRWRLESATRVPRTGSVQDLLAFLRTVDESVPEGSELHVMLDEFSDEATHRLERWMQARRARFHRYRVPAGITWTESVDRWWTRWPSEEKGGPTSRHVGECVESLVQFLGRQSPAVAPFAWIPSYTARAESAVRY
jgi:putative transposase